MSKDAYARYTEYLATYNGRELLKKYHPNTQGIWVVHGEDPNCDLGGHHHEPLLGYFEGRLEDVVAKVVMLPGFWQWGGGGRIEPREEPLITKVKSVKEERMEELKTRIESLEKELRDLKAERNLIGGGS